MPNLSFSVHEALPKTVAIVMGGGKGQRLFPLTKERAKPAVPLGGKYRLVDIPLSNCLSSGLNNIYVLTQYNSHSLNRHIGRAYKLDNYRQGFVEIIAAQQTDSGGQWFQGTADAVRQSLNYISYRNYDYFIILSGDQLYKLNMINPLSRHIQADADITISTIPVNKQDAKKLGIMQVDPDGKITRFEEKPQDEEVLAELDISSLPPSQHIASDGTNNYLASMGIYIFNRKALLEVLDNDFEDFGRHIIPDAIKNYKVFNYLFKGYWEDIGTIKAFYEANLGLTDTVPKYDFFTGSIFTSPRFLPSSKVNGASIDHALISDGCIISHASIRRSIVGVRSKIERNTTIERSVIMGSDYYEDARTPRDGLPANAPPIGIGQNCRIQEAIIDKGARIGNNCVITPYNKDLNMDGENFYVRDGIVIIPKGGIIPDGSHI